MIGADTETELFNDYCAAPRPIVLTLYSDTSKKHGERPPQWTRDLMVEFPHWASLKEDGMQWFFAATGPALHEAVRQALRHELVWHNQAFDLLVVGEHVPGALPLVFHLLGSGRGSCTMVREKLLAIADGLLQGVGQTKGYFSLNGLVRRYFGVDLEGKSGPDAWRFRYHELRAVPFDYWPNEAKDYALFDAKWAFDVYGAQCHHYPTDTQTGAVIVHPDGRICDELRQTRADFCLQLMAAEGVRVDPIAAAHTLQAWQTIAREGEAVGRAAGFVRADGSKNIKALRDLVIAAYERLGITPPHTETGAKKLKAGLIAEDDLHPQYTSYSNDTLMESGDEVLKAYAEASTYINYLSKFGPSLTAWASGVSSRPNVLVDTGRTSWSKPARQQPPKKGGYRECHVPRPGYLISSTDYNQIELVALAYVLEVMGFGSGMANDIREGLDLHVVAGVGLGNADPVNYRPPGGAVVWTYDIFQACRQGEYGADYQRMADEVLRAMAKVQNFGLPGGLGAVSLRSYAIQTYGIELTPQQAEFLVQVYRTARPEAVEYFRYNGQLSAKYDNNYTVVQLDSGRVRGGCRYTSGCNTYFQGKAADGIKDAMWLLAKEMYLDRSSVLFGSRAWLMVHDEILFYHPEVVAPGAADRAAEVMIEAMSAVVPGLPVKAGPALMDRWYKKAAEVRDASGRLMVWQPKKKKKAE